MDGIIALVMFVTIIFLICSLCGWCCQRKQKGIVFSRPGDNVENPYDPNYGHTNPYPTQQIVPNSQQVPVSQTTVAAYPRQQYHPPIGYGMPPYQPGYPPVGYPPVQGYIAPSNTTAPYPVTTPYPMAMDTSIVMPTTFPQPSSGVPTVNPPYPTSSVPQVPVGTAPKLPSYQEATGSNLTNELYSKQAPYNPDFN